MLDRLKTYESTPKLISGKNIILELCFGLLVVIVVGFIFHLDIWFSLLQLGILIFAIYARTEQTKGKVREYIAIDLDKKLVIIDNHKIPFNKIKETKIHDNVVEVHDYEERVIEVMTPNAKKFFQDLQEISKTGN